MIRLDAPVAERIRAHAARLYAEEACGALFGRDEPGGRRVLAAEPLDNARATERHRRFVVTPADYRRAEARAVAMGLELVGFYHSHPDHPAFPSDYDRAHAWPFFSYVIVSVRQGRPEEMRSFRLRENRELFDEERLVVAEAGGRESGGPGIAGRAGRE